MNLNANNRLESFDISADAELTAFYERIADDIWDRFDADSRTQSEKVFRDLLGAGSVKNPKRPNPFGLATA